MIQNSTNKNGGKNISFLLTEKERSQCSSELFTGTLLLCRFFYDKNANPNSVVEMSFTNTTPMLSNQTTPSVKKNKLFQIE